MNEVVERKASTTEIGFTSTGAGLDMTPQNLNEVVRFGEVMARASLALPKHCRGDVGICVAITLQALKWDMDPFAVANKSYAVNDRLAYEAQLIAAVVHTRAGIKGRPTYEFLGEGPKMVCKVTCTLRDGTERVYVSPEVGQIKVKNSPLWATDPQQQLGYYAVRSWARRYVPEVLLGIYDRDEIEGIEPRDVTPAKPSMADRYTKAPIDRTDEWEARNDKQAETIIDTVVIEDEPAAEKDMFADSGATPTPDSGEAAPPATPAEASPPPLSPEEARLLYTYFKGLTEVITKSVDDEPAARQKTLKRASDVMKMDKFTDAPDHIKKAAATILDALNGVIKKESTVEFVTEQVTEMLGEEPA